MTQTQVKIKFTVEDYQHLPESETKRYELLGGELILAPSPTSEHQRISWELEFRLSQLVRAQSMGVIFNAPLDVILSDEDVVQPDILFISRERSEIIHEDAIHGAPDLVIEILSPATAERDRTYKRTLYARSGVQEYWLVDPDSKSIEVLALGPQGYQLAGRYEQSQTLRSPLLAGLSIALGEIF